MPKYEVKKLSAHMAHYDESTYYEYTLAYDTWAQLVKDMHNRRGNNNVIFYGNGADVFMHGKKIGHTAFLLYANNISKVSREAFIEEVAHDLEPF